VSNRKNTEPNGNSSELTKVQKLEQAG
jgi:hypothetical protein